MKINRTVNSVLFFCLCIQGIVGLAYHLHTTLHPWELQFKIPSGLDEMEYGGTSIGEINYLKLADLSPDQKTLLVACPDGRCEIWNLAEGKKITSLGRSAPNPNEKLSLLHRVHFFPDGKRILADIENGKCRFDVIGLDKKNYRSFTSRSGYFWKEVAISPNGMWLAFSSHRNVVVFEPHGRRISFEAKFEHLNGGRGRLQWSPDGKHLLLNDLLGVRVWNVAEGKLEFFHRELDLHLPLPMIADDNTGIKKVELDGRRDNDYARKVALLVDSQIAPNGKYVACLYQPYNSWRVFNYNQKKEEYMSRLRFYGIRKGALLWDEELDAHPEHITFSKDGSLLYVYFSPDFKSHIKIYDTQKRQLVKELKVKLVNSFPARLTPCPDNRWIALYSNKLWLVDTHEIFTPIEFDSSPNVVNILFTSDGERMIEVGVDKTVRVWKQKGSLSQWGLYARIETYAIYFLVLALGLFALYLAGRGKEIDMEKRIPRRLWFAMVLLSAFWAWAVADGILDYASKHVYAPNKVVPQWIWVVALFVKAFLIYSYAMVLRLRQRWRVLVLILVGMGVLLNLVYIAIISFLWAAGNLDPAFLKVESLGMRLALAPWELLAWSGFFLIAGCVVFWLLKGCPRELFLPLPKSSADN